MKKHTIAIITAIIVAIMIVTMFFFIPWFSAQQDKAEIEAYQETQK